jgi:hypothetical protein
MTAGYRVLPGGDNVLNHTLVRTVLTGPGSAATLHGADGGQRAPGRFECARKFRSGTRERP